MKKTSLIFFFALLALAVSAMAAPMTTVKMKLSGPGAVNDSTIKAGEKVSLDLYFGTKQELRAVSFGFRLYSPDIKSVQHVGDTAKGLTEAGDIHGSNGWNDFTKWDFLNRAVLKNWDGALPDTLGFVAAVAKKKYMAHEEMKIYSMDIVAATPGTLVMDTVFYEPGGSFKAILAPSGAMEPKQEERPLWKGPYKFKVVK